MVVVMKERASEAQIDSVIALEVRQRRLDLDSAIRSIAVADAAVRSAAEARYCPVVFVPARVWERNRGVLDQLQGHGVLTVGESKEFAEAGGIIGFVIQDANVRFVVNLDARDRAGLRISSRMLALAETLVGGRPVP